MRKLIQHVALTPTYVKSHVFDLARFQSNIDPSDGVRLTQIAPRMSYHSSGGFFEFELYTL